MTDSIDDMDVGYDSDDDESFNRGVLMSKKSTRSESFVLPGTIYWAHVHEPHTKGKYSSGKYQCDLSLDKENIAKLKEMGVKLNKNDGKDKGGIKNRDDERGQFVTPTSEYPTRVVDSKKNPIPSSTKIGNGSTVNALVHTYDSENGVALGLDAIQILELEPYADTKLNAFDTVDGYIAAEIEENDGEEDSTPMKVSKDNPF